MPTMSLNTVGPAVPPQTHDPESQPHQPQQSAAVPQPPRTRPGWLLPTVVVSCAVAIAAAVVWLAWPSSSGPSRHLVAGTVQTTVLSADEVSKLAGTTVVSAASASAPPPALNADQAGCAVAVGPATQAVYGHDWTGFLSVTYQDVARKGSITVTQVAAVFPNADKAGAAFKTLSDGLKGCKSASVTDRGGRATQWHYKLGTQDAAALGWTATQDAGGGWACHRQARLTGTSVVQVAVCDAGNGDAIASAVTDRITARAKG